MYARILVATDGSTLSKKAVANAIGLAECLPGQVGSDNNPAAVEDDDIGWNRIEDGLLERFLKEMCLLRPISKAAFP